MWALYINDPATHSTVHHIVYNPDRPDLPATVKELSPGEPRDISQRYRDQFLVGHIDRSKVAKVRKEIQGVKERAMAVLTGEPLGRDYVNDDSRNGGSQKWVIHTLEMLQAKGYMTFVKGATKTVNERKSRLSTFPYELRIRRQ